MYEGDYINGEKDNDEKKGNNFIIMERKYFYDIF